MNFPGRPLQGRELPLKGRNVDVQRTADMDQMVRRGAKPLFLHEHLFIELLARAQAGIADLDIHVRLKAGKDG